jgi:hypothetical protein
MQNQKQKRKAYPSDLTHKQFDLLGPLLKVKPKKTGRPKADLEEVVNGMLYRPFAK